MLESKKVIFASKGIVAQSDKDNVKTTRGDIIKIIELDAQGIIISFDKSLKPSANACKRP